MSATSTAAMTTMFVDLIEFHRAVIEQLNQSSTTIGSTGCLSKSGVLLAHNFDAVW